MVFGKLVMVPVELWNVVKCCNFYNTLNKTVVQNVVFLTTSLEWSEAGLAEAGKHIGFVGFDAGLVERVDALEFGGDGTGEFEEIN